MFQVVLFQPEIPPNTGNIIRLCANTGCRLHLIEPLGFSLEDRHLRRAGLDYRDLAVVERHASLEAFLGRVDPAPIYPFTTRADRWHVEVRFREGDLLLFGPETRGLPQEILERFPKERWLRLPMRPGNRSLNLANAVAVAVYEAWRQNGFKGAV